MREHLVRLTYYSAAPETLTRGDLHSILDAAQTNNARLGITGGLGFNRRRFIQTLEGERSAVTRLLCRIFADPRHNDPIIVSCHAIDERAFPDWSMMWLGEELFTDRLSQKYCGARPCSFDDLDDDELERFVLDLGREQVRRERERAAAF